jgi:hypothetical protein
MDGEIKSIAWEAPEYYHVEKKSDWFWVLWILVIAGSLTSIFLGNYLLGILILLGGAAMALIANREPNVVPFAVTTRGIRIDDMLYPYSTLDSFYIEDEVGPYAQLLVKSQKTLAPLLVIPIPDDYIDEIESILETRLAQEHLEEPFAHKLLEFFGF